MLLQAALVNPQARASVDKAAAMQSYADWLHAFGLTITPSAVPLKRATIF